MVGRWARDIAYALLRLGWSARWEDIRNEFINNQELYPQASDFIDRESLGRTSQDGSWRTMGSTFGKHSTTSKQNNDEQKIFRHLDGNKKQNEGYWELLYYDTHWDDEFERPEHLESVEIRNYHCNPSVSNYLSGLNFPDEPGEVYLITNPAWPGWIKCGKSGSVSGRLSSYQTGSPLRDYVELDSRFFPDCGAAEKIAHKRLRRLSTNWDYEWFEINITDAKKILWAI